MRCKFTLSYKQEINDGINLGFYAVYNGSEENKQYWKLTPAGQLNLFTINKEAAAKFELGTEYYLNITAA